MKRPEIEGILDRSRGRLIKPGWETVVSLEAVCNYVLYLEAELRKFEGLLIPAQTLTGSGAITTTLDQGEELK